MSKRNEYFSKLTFAQKLKNQDKWLGAANILESLIQAYPEEAEAYIELAGLYLHRNEVQYAQKFLLQAYDLFPENAEILFMLGNSYLIGGGQEREALRYYNQIDITFPELHYNRGLAHSRLGHHQEAIECMEKSLQHAARQHQCYFILVHEFNVLQHHEKVLETVQRAEQNGIHSGYLYFMAGMSNNHLKKYFPSAKYFQKAINHGYDDPQAFRSLAKAYSDLGLNNQHHRILQKAIQRYPHHKIFYYDLALALFQEKKYGEAREILLQLPENQRDVIARELLSEIQHKMEKRTKSID